MNDLYSLVEPQQPLDVPYEAGDSVSIRTNVDRLVDHGWITDTEQTNGTASAVLTTEGAALLNYYARGQTEGWLGKELRHGGGWFAERAIKTEHEQPEIVEFDGEAIVLRMPDGSTRTYVDREQYAIA